MIGRSISGTVLRIWLVFDGLAFGSAAAFNFGAAVVAGPIDVRFEQPIWQAGIGEAVIAAALGFAGVTGRRILAWIGFGASVVGIVFGLNSRRVVGAARDIHVVLVPMAVVLLVTLLLSLRRPTGNAGSEG